LGLFNLLISGKPEISGANPESSYAKFLSMSGFRIAASDLGFTRDRQFKVAQVG
jgi:hypothetical protein